MGKTDDLLNKIISGKITESKLNEMNRMADTAKSSYY